MTIHGVERIHPLIEGIYKPKWSEYALSIASMKVNPYNDRIRYLKDGRWKLQYSAKKGGPLLAINKSLLKCLSDREPIIVLEQISNKNSKNKTQYRLMGLGLIDNYDPASDLFTINHIDYATLEKVSYGASDELIVEAALREFTLEEFTPFVAEEKAVYTVSSQKRNQSFKNIILDQYQHTCSVTGLRYHSDNLVEAQAAHIISKSKNGSDDPRNGIALSRSAHWAFDVGLFTISDQYEVVVNPKAKHASVNKFPILSSEGKRIQLPEDENFHPHISALEWHKKEVFEKFKL